MVGTVNDQGLRKGVSVSKFYNKKTVIDGMTFDSRKEAKRYQELILLERGKEITHLQTQVRFELIPSQKIGGKTIERPATYIADFVYHRADGSIVVEDVKSEATRKLPCYILKRKLMLFREGIQIHEI